MMIRKMIKSLIVGLVAVGVIAVPAFAAMNLSIVPLDTVYGQGDTAVYTVKMTATAAHDIYAVDAYTTFSAADFDSSASSYVDYLPTPTYSWFNNFMLFFSTSVFQCSKSGQNPFVAVMNVASGSVTDIYKINLKVKDAASLGTKNIEFRDPNSSFARILAPAAADITGTRTETTITIVNGITSVAPNSGDQGQTLSVTINGSGFVNGVNAVFYRDGGSTTGITVNSTTYNSPTQIVANITIAAGATAGSWNLKVMNAGTPVAAKHNAFTVTTTAPASLSSATPNSAYQGDVVSSVVIVGSNTHFGAASNISFGTGISYASQSVADQTHITANTVTINTTAASGLRQVSVTTGGEVANGNILTINVPSINSLTPNSGEQGETLNILVSGTGTHFQDGVTTASVSGSGITVNSVTVTSPTLATVNVTIASGAGSGARNLTVSTDLGARGTESIVSTGGFTVTVPGAPATPTNLTISGIGDSYATPSWWASTGATDYEISYGPDAAASQTQVTTTETWRTVNNLTPGTTYYVKVRAHNASGYSPYTSIVSFETTGGGDTLSAPTNLKIEGIGTTYATPSWYSVTDADDYELSYGTNSSASQHQIVTAETWRTLIGLTAGTKYYVKVRARSQTKGNSPYSNIVSFETVSENVVPHIDSLDPLDGPPGTIITLSGVNFGASQGSSLIMFKGMAVSTSDVVSWSNAEIKVKVPADFIPGAYRVEVLRRMQISGQDIELLSNGIEFEITAFSGVTKAYPNPFNPLKEILHVRINLTSTAQVGVYVYDINGRLVWKNVASKPAGQSETTWDGTTAFQEKAGDGVYLIRVVNEGSKALISKGKIIVIKK